MTDYATGARLLTAATERRAWAAMLRTLSALPPRQAVSYHGVVVNTKQRADALRTRPTVRATDKYYAADWLSVGERNNKCQRRKHKLKV